MLSQVLSIQRATELSLRTANAASSVERSRAQRARPSPLHLGFGRDDRFATSHRMMASALAPESVDVVPGGHEWPVWRQLWGNFLDARLSANTATT